MRPCNGKLVINGTNAFIIKHYCPTHFFSLALIDTEIAISFVNCFKVIFT